MRTSGLWPIAALVLLPAALAGQEPTVGHTDTTGRLYVHPDHPVYLYLSTSPDGQGAVRLRSMQPEGNPLRWDGHGGHRLTHLNLFLGRRVRFDIFADGRPPRTSAQFDAQLGTQRGQAIYLSGAAVVELAAVDAHAGLARTYYSVNGAEFAPYTQPLVFEREGEYTLRFYSVDHVGNREDAGERTLIVDTTPPATTLAVEGPRHRHVVGGGARLALTATDAVGVRGTWFSINGAEPAPYHRPIALAPLGQGEHTIAWFSEDVVGNRERPNEFTFFVDNTPPMVFEELEGNTFMVAGREFSSGRSQLRIVALDNKAGVQSIYYSINQGEFIRYHRPIYLSEISGALSIRSYAIDSVGNRGTSDAHGQQLVMPEIDITGPAIRHGFIGPRIVLRDTLWVAPTTRVSLTATDRGAGLSRIEYTHNSGAPQPYTEPFAVPEPGYHAFRCTAFDHVENLNIHAFSFGVDANAPALHHTFSVRPHAHIAPEGGAPIPVFAPGVLLFLAATDDIAGLQGIHVSVNGLPERVYTAPLQGFRAGQTHTIRLRATDRLGNQSAQELRFRVE